MREVEECTISLPRPQLLRQPSTVNIRAVIALGLWPAFSDPGAW